VRNRIICGRLGILRIRNGVAMENSNLGISIIIPSKGRVKLLGDLLESVYIARQKYMGKSEVIIVDDSNEKDVSEIKGLCGKYDSQMVYFSPSVSGKRNYGALKAKYEIVLFLDSDCLATPNLLSEHVKFYTNKKVGAVVGLLEFTGEDTWFWKVVGNSQFVTPFYLPRWAKKVSWGPTANFSVQKSVFNQIKGFDEGFPNKPGGEDVDLGLRIINGGYTIACTAAGLVYHSKQTWIPVKDMFKRLWNYGSADYFLIKKHPNYTMNVLPRRTLVYLLIALVMINIAILKSWIFLVLIPVWFIFDLSLTSIFTNICSKDKKVTFLQQFVIQILVMTNEMGFMARTLQKKCIQYWFKQIVTFEGQLESALQSGSINMWSHIISLCVLLVIIFL
jgi:glycosyltransferase involved in cell wall biosynthesis